jgi:hypothetical protein
VTTNGNGTVEPSSGTYEAGESVVLTATPAEGYRFDRWEGDLTGSENPATIVMQSNRNVIAVFVRIPKPNREKIAITARLFDSEGAPVGNTEPVMLDVTVKLFDAASEGNLLYTETFLTADAQAIAVERGYFTARLGEGTTLEDLASVITGNQNLWAEIQIGTDILQRVPLTGAAYAISNR